MDGDNEMPTTDGPGLAKNEEVNPLTPQPLPDDIDLDEYVLYFCAQC